jgi:DNA-binding transcriptional ArsR family regulator
METPHPLPEPLVQLIAQRFRVLGEPLRIQLLDALRDGEKTVGELTAQVAASQQNVSKHLGVLHQAGLIDRSKQGTFVRYAITDPWVFELCDLVCGNLRQRVSELGQILSGGTA